jgi:hypothetical protein
LTKRHYWGQRVYFDLSATISIGNLISLLASGL